MKRLLLVLTCLFLSFNLFAQSNKEKKDLIIFAAASMTETLTDIKELYEKEHKDVNIVYNFDSSGTLKTQIEMGADCDIFISASTKQINQLKEKNLVDESTEKILLENKTVLVVPDNNPKHINSFNDLVSLLRNKDVFLAIGNSDVPVGQYTLNIFNYFKIREDDIKSCLSYGSNVKEVTVQVKANMVDCGIIYATDAYSAKLNTVDTATEEMTGGRVLYPMAVLSKTDKKDLCLDFMNYLYSESACKIFEEVGFTVLR